MKLHRQTGSKRRSFLLQQGGDVDVPADGLPVEAAGEQVAGGVVFTPGGAAHHAAVTLSHDRHNSCSELARGQRKHSLIGR